MECFLGFFIKSDFSVENGCLPNCKQWYLLAITALCLVIFVTQTKDKRANDESILVEGWIFACGSKKICIALSILIRVSLICLDVDLESPGQKIMIM